MPDEEISVEAESTPPPVAQKKKPWLWVLLVLGLVLAGGLAWLARQGSTGAAEPAAEATFSLETFVVNLSGSGQRAYLRVGITLGLAHPLPHNRPEAVPTALIRDTILSVLATARPEELLKVEGKQELKEELLKTLQERVPQIAVQNVYFTEFLVQM